VTSRRLDQSFGKEVRHLAVPITGQGVLAATLAMTDQLMVGQLGEMSIAGAGIGTKISSIVLVILIGIGTGTSVYCSQYWGERDYVRIRQLLGLGLLVALAIIGSLSLLIGLRPSIAVSAFATDEALLSVAGDFVRVLAISFIPVSLTIIYSAVLRSTGQVKLPLYASAIAVAVNILLDYLLIFGHLGMPELGLMGAALGTTIARFLEAGIILVGTYRLQHVAAVRRLRDLRGSSVGFTRAYMLVTLPLTVNELMWVLGDSTYVVVYGRMGTDALAAMSMTFPLQSLSIGLLNGLGGAAAVMVGKRLGRNDVDKAVSLANRITLLGAGLSIPVGIVVAALSSIYVGVFKTSPDVQESGRLCILVFCGFLWIKVINMILAGAVLNSGGKTRFVLIVESLSTWVVGVPIAFLAAFWLDLPIHWVYLLLSVEEIVRLVAYCQRLASRRWARNLVRHVSLVDAA